MCAAAFWAAASLHNKNDLLPVIQKTLGVSKVKVRESIMAKKKKDTMEFRFYELPQGEAALVLCGESWVRVYGHEELHLHFHNLMELGICRRESEVCFWMRKYTNITPAI